MPAAPSLSPLSRISLESQAIHVLTLHVAVPPDVRGRCWDVLSADERARAIRFHFKPLQEHFIVVHGAMRMILAQYLSRPPAEIQFDVASTGKPSLAGADSWLRFNLSHTDAVALHVVTAAL